METKQRKKERFSYPDFFPAMALDCFDTRCGNGLSQPSYNVKRIPNCDLACFALRAFVSFFDKPVKQCLIPNAGALLWRRGFTEDVLLH